MRAVRRVLTCVVSLLLFVAVLAVLPAGPASATPVLGALAGAGERPGATRLGFYAGDSVAAQVDVGSGNLLVSVKSLALPDVNGQLQLGATYNSAVGSTDTVLPRLGGRGWSLDYTDDVRMVAETATPATSAVTYRAPGGLVGVFTPIAGSSNPVRYTAPAGFKTVLTYDTAGYKLVDSESQQTRLFSTGGLLTAVKDRNANTTTTTTSGTGGSVVTIRTAASTLEPSTAVVSKPSSSQTRVKQGSATTLRTNLFDISGETVSKFTDALGRVTTFTYAGTSGVNAGRMTKITAPGSVVTSFVYDSGGRVVSVSQVDQAAGSSVTRLAYPSTTTTQVADPTTNQSQAVSAVPRTTYTLDGTQRVTNVVDAAGRQRSRTYTPDFDTATATTGVGAGSDTTTNTFGANTGQSLTKSASSTGASSGLSYATASGPGQYLPTGGTDDAGNASIYTYNGPGNQLTSTNANQAQAQVSYNTDGTVATATSPGNGTNVTSYGYTNKQPTSITPVTGTSLGSRALTYDTVGRLKTSTNGRGITTTYTYDNNDRVTKTAFSDGDQVTYGYDAAGRLNNRVDTNGTTAWVYDDLARLKSRQNTAGGGQVSYGYDKASRLTTSTSTNGGTVTYGYDAAGLPTTITYPAPGGGTAQMVLAYDTLARLVSTTLASTNGGTNYAARASYGYDTAGRVTSVTANLGPATANVIDLAYCYMAGTAPAGGCTATAANDRAKLVWRKDNLGGRSTTYTYDTSGRLTNATNNPGPPAGEVDDVFTYDARNNRTSATPVPGDATSGTQAFTFNAANQITTGDFLYDGAGNINESPADGASNIGYTAADQLRNLTTGAGTSKTSSPSRPTRRSHLSQ